MHADRGGTSENEDEDGDDEDKDEDDDDDVFDDDMLPATQPPELLSQVYDVESPDGNIPHIPRKRGDPNDPTLPDIQHNHTADPDVQCPSRTQTQVNWLTFKSRSYTSPL